MLLLFLICVLSGIIGITIFFFKYDICRPNGIIHKIIETEKRKIWNRGAHPPAAIVMIGVLFHYAPHPTKDSS